MRFGVRDGSEVSVGFGIATGAVVSVDTRAVVGVDTGVAVGVKVRAGVAVDTGVAVRATANSAAGAGVGSGSSHAMARTEIAIKTPGRAQRLFKSVPSDHRWASPESSR